MLGAIECSILVEIERRTGKLICELFDLGAGTSIGGIMILLASLGIPASEIMKFFTSDGPNIFNGRLFGRDGVLEPRYSAEAIETVLQMKFGVNLMRDAKMPVLVPAFDLVTGRPVMFKSYKADSNAAPMWAMARGTSAAQTYFPAFRIDDMVLWDGGNVANSPGVCALADLALTNALDGIQLLSLGCGQRPWTVDADGMINAGIAKVAEVMCSSLIGAEQEEVDYQLSAFMGDNYVRINPVLAEALPIDDASPAGLVKLALAGASNVAAAKPLLDTFFADDRQP